VQDFIEQMAFCVAIGCALSLVVAAALSGIGRPAFGVGVLPRLLLVVGPIFLSVDYLTYQDAALIVCAGAGAAVCLYILRGWWAPDYRPCISAASWRPSLGSPRYDTIIEAHPSVLGAALETALKLARKGQAPPIAAAALRDRVLSVVGNDRRAGRPVSDRSLSRAA
jgi:hypothetical protein